MDLITIIWIATVSPCAVALLTIILSVLADYIVSLYKKSKKITLSKRLQLKLERGVQFYANKSQEIRRKHERQK